jgi:hypothetical protein
MGLSCVWLIAVVVWCEDLMILSPILSPEKWFDHAL